MDRRIARSIAWGVVVAVSSAFSSLTSVAHAQLGRARAASAEPNYWVGLSIGYVDGMTLSDNTTQSTWNFGSSTQIRATLEKKLDAGVTGGVSAGFSTAPLTYTPGIPSSGVLGPCGTGCQANADINQYTLFIRGGGGTGFHGMYNLEGGATRISNFREQGTSAQLDPQKGSYDLTLGFGGGFAYGLSTGADIYVSEAWDYIFHKQISTTTTSAPRVNVLRGGLRFGF